MTLPVLSKPNWKIILGIPLFIFFSCFLITLSSKFRLHPELLSKGILLDLLVTAPAAYFIAIRKTAISKLTVIRVIILGLLFAGWILQSGSSPTLHLLKTWISPLLEIVVIVFIYRKFNTATKNARKAGGPSVDFLTVCRNIMLQVTGNEKFGNIIASEIAVFYYSFRGFTNRPVDYKTTFSNYKENGVVAVFAIILLVFVIETTGLHFLISIWSKTFAWVLTVLSLYSCMQIVAHARALKARPIIIGTGSVEIHNGLSGDVTIPFDDIEQVECSNKKPGDRTAIKIALLKGLENHNIVIRLKKPVEVIKMFGIKKHSDTILFFVDRPKDFLNSIQTGMASK